MNGSVYTVHVLEDARKFSIFSILHERTYGAVLYRHAHYNFSSAFCCCLSIIIRFNTIVHFLHLFLVKSHLFNALQRNDALLVFSFFSRDRETPIYFIITFYIKSAILWFAF